MPDYSADRTPKMPIAIIGIGCRFPGGVTGPDSYWRLLSGGVDATRDLPPGRWAVDKFYDPEPGKSGKMATFHGGFLERIDEFDAQFFGISPREAIWLDPQQRMLLQVTWEALEDAGQVAEQLAGSDIGVFVGGFTLDYQLLQNYGVYSRYQLQTHSATGMMMTMLANRLSYIFDFRGPSMAIDTACSASLVATHLAVQSIWNGECALAVAGGSNVMIAPNMTIAESKGGFLAPDGRCKTFDVSANGYARGEGAAVVLLKPLDRALADGDPVYAVICGTAVTQDGHTNGITVPNPVAQEQAMLRAYRTAGIVPSQVQYVEAHGTGTPVGDPIEARAIGSVVSAGRPEDQRCLIGSVKTNIGHLEAAAGVAGLIKTALALKHRQIPPHLHLHEPNRDIPFDELRLRVPTTLEEWPACEGPRYAGVNSFGFGGTNAHVVLREAPERVDRLPHDGVGRDRTYLLPMSARSPEALTEVARAYRNFLSDQPPDLRDLAYSASLRRSHHDHRLALSARSASEAVGKLDAYLTDGAAPGGSAGPLSPGGVSSGRVQAGGPPKVAFVCSGMGPQWWAMARSLLTDEPVFRAAVERCDAELARYTGWSLLEAMTAAEDESRMAETEIAQPANFAVQVGLYDLWRSWGIEPAAVIGHSTGEVAAQYIAGVLSFAEAIRVVYYRSSLQQRASGSGRMLAVGLTPETLQKAVDDAGPLVSVAAINSPSAVTVAGDADILEGMAAQLETFGVFHRFLRVRVPYHSHYMDPLHDDLISGLAGLAANSARIPFYSTVTGTRIEGSSVDETYWWRNVRGTVLFAAAFEQMLSDGYRVFVELGPHPVLASSMRELLAQQEIDGVVVPSLQRGKNDAEVALGSLGTLYAHGCRPAWERLNDPDGRFVALPGYPWQLRSYWNESPEASIDRHYSQVHPLLGQRIEGVHPTWELELSATRLPYLADHRVQDNVLLPGAAFIEMAVAAARQVYGGTGLALERVQFRKALLLTGAADPRLRTVIYPDRGSVEISSYAPTSNGGGQWILHCTAEVRQRHASQNGALTHLELRATCPEHLPRQAFYLRTQQMGFQYGPSFQAVEEIHAGPGRAVGTVRRPDTLDADVAAYHFHPSLIDASFQILLAAATPPSDEAGQSAPYLPVSIERLRILAPPQREMHVAVEVVTANERLIVSDIHMFDAAGRPLLDIEGFKAQSLETATSLARDRIDKGLYEIEWQPARRPEPDGQAEEPDGQAEEPGTETWLILADRGGVGRELARQASERGSVGIVVSHADVPRLRERDGGITIDSSDPDQYRELVESVTGRGHIARVVHLWNLDSACGDTGSVPQLERDIEHGTLSIMYLIQALAQGGSPLPRIWLVTQQAQPVGEGQQSLSVAQAPAWGLGRVIGHQEFRSMWGGLIDLDGGPVTELAATLYEEITEGEGEDQVGFRNGQRYVPRLVESPSLTHPLPPSLRVDGSYLVTGGLGALGLLVARFLVDNGARHLILTGRSVLPERSAWRDLSPEHPRWGLIQQLVQLEQSGATVQYVSLDVGDEHQMTRWLADHRSERRPPIRGLVHTAGVVADELLLRMSPERFRRVLRPKVAGSWLLHRLLGTQLDFFVLFSSVGSVIASPGQGNYAAGNAFLDGLAHYRRGMGIPGLSIGWGPWSVGMVQELELEQVYARRGIELITPEAGTQILGRVLSQPPAHLTAITADWARARETSPLGTLPAMFSGLGQPDQAGDGPSPENDTGVLLAALRQAQPADRAQLIVAHLEAVMAHVLQLDPGTFSDDEPLTSLGMDSMMAIEVKHRVEAATGVDVSVLELLQGVSITALAGRIVASLQFGQPADGSSDIAAAQDAPASAEVLTEELERMIAEMPAEQLEQLLAELEQDEPSREGAK